MSVAVVVRQVHAAIERFVLRRLIAKGQLLKRNPREHAHPVACASQRVPKVDKRLFVLLGEGLIGPNRFVVLVALLQQVFNGLRGTWI